jgi:hypothetical protein
MEECIFVMHNRRWIAQNNCDRIEAHLVPLDAGAGYVTTGSARDVLLLFQIDGAFREPGFRRTACFDFDENQQIAASRHDIHFRIGAGTVVPGHDGEAHLAQITMRQVFSTLADCRFGAQDAALAELPSPVAELPEELAWPDTPVLRASSCHSMTLPRTT